MREPPCVTKRVSHGGKQNIPIATNGLVQASLLRIFPAVALPASDRRGRPQDFFPLFLQPEFVNDFCLVICAFLEADLEQQAEASFF